MAFCIQRHERSPFATRSMSSWSPWNEMTGLTGLTGLTMLEPLGSLLTNAVSCVYKDPQSSFQSSFQHISTYFNIFQHSGRLRITAFFFAFSTRGASGARDSCLLGHSVCMSLPNPASDGGSQFIPSDASRKYLGVQFYWRTLITRTMFFSKLSRIQSGPNSLKKLFSIFCDFT